MEETKRDKLTFLALDPYVEKAIPSPVEKEIHGKDMVQWGDGNKYPEYLWELYGNVATLRAIVNGTRDFVVGDSQAIQFGALEPDIVNKSGQTIREVMEAIATDLIVFGGFALQVIRNAAGEPLEVYYVPMRYLRMNKDANVFYYSEKWAKGGTNKAVVYPAFMQISPERWTSFTPEQKERHLSSILLVKDTITQTYPSPVYLAAINDCETERQVSEFHLNAVNNGFTSSMIVNFNSGTPDDETKAEIERSFSEKFTGAKNAGRVMFAFNPDRTNAVTITEPKVDNFGDRYTALSQHTQRQIFTAFRATPVIFGIPTDNNGFAADDYENAFRLYNRTTVRPMQRKICDAFDKILGRSHSLTITPFSLNEGSEQTVS